ncbi:response regulator transcription factor [Nonomuraea soli]|uniref:DNA-binding NarL/FixJ family response regulator n=1 Tax=Nonomuraea soli TaxID=1032476 RepID=A0A7W0HTX9_9ACTN|nr:response regulator transcription factor [Nonomuraea soli]MBA2895495.1 DNA-binding NarL/FixJ family response regulator [Nonomuraea soli]
MPKVVIADDDPLVRAGLRMILGGAPEVEIAGEAGDGREALAVVARERPDLVLMDIRMPVMDGLRATKALRERGRLPRIVILTTFDADDLVLTALRHGADGFLVKDTEPEEIVRAVRRVMLGEPMLSPGVTGRLIATVTGSGLDERRRLARARLARLTTREREVAVAISEGLTNGEIATALHLGIATVKTYVGHVFAKLEVTNRVQVARYVNDASS